MDALTLVRSPLPMRPVWVCAVAVVGDDDLALGDHGADVFGAQVFIVGNGGHLLRN